MPIEITMPRLSDTMEEGTLVKWRVKVGDEVAASDHLADVETDKATMELQAFDDGTVARIDVEEGQTVPVGQAILVLAGEGESVEEAAKSKQKSKAQSQESQQEPEEEGGGTKTGGRAAKAKEGEAEAGGREADQGGRGSEAGGREPEAAAQGSGERVRISPLAKKLAREHKVDPAKLTGSGPSGRIIKADVLAAAESAQGGGPAGGKGEAEPGEAKAGKAPSMVPAGGGLEAKAVQLTSMRKTIARRLVESKTTVPHFQVSLGIDMDPLLALRQTLNDQLQAQGIKLSVNDFVTRATALACIQHPVVNSSWAGDTIQQHGTVHVGIAVALPQPPQGSGGLIVPVIRDVQTKGLRQLSQQTRSLAKKARESGLSAEEMAEGTITISNLGMYGIDQFNAIINPPQAAILAVGGAIEKPVVKDGRIVVGRVMTATLSGDHRVIDGAVAAEYLQTFKQMLENPAALLV